MNCAVDAGIYFAAFYGAEGTCCLRAAWGVCLSALGWKWSYMCVCVFMGLENALTLAIQTHISPQSPRTSSLHLAYSLPHHAGEFEY